jgi:hypothetical protein
MTITGEICKSVATALIAAVEAEKINFPFFFYREMIFE